MHIYLLEGGPCLTLLCSPWGGMHRCGLCVPSLPSWKPWLVVGGAWF